MPFKSDAQRRFMFSQHPQLAKEWAAKTPKGDLPERVGKKKGKAEARKKALRKMAGGK